MLTFQVNKEIFLLGCIWFFKMGGGGGGGG